MVYNKLWPKPKIIDVKVYGLALYTSADKTSNWYNPCTSVQSYGIFAPALSVTDTSIFIFFSSKQQELLMIRFVQQDNFELVEVILFWRRITTEFNLNKLFIRLFLGIYIFQWNWEWLHVHLYCTHITFPLVWNVFRGNFFLPCIYQAISFQSVMHPN